MAEYLAAQDSRTTLVCIDSYEEGELRGRFYHPAMEDGDCFHSLTQLLVKLERLLDGARAPQSFTTARSFGRVIPVWPEERFEAAPRSGKLATLSVRILFRRNATWQGTVTWLEGNETGNFRSVLELILLVDSALRRAGDGGLRRAEA